MPEYQEILDSEVQPEAPLTSSLGVRFRDNPLAVWEGAPSAPRIQTDALSDSAVTQAKLRIGTNSVSGLILSDSSENISMTDYALFPSIHQGGGFGGPLRVQASSAGSSASSNPKFTLQNVSTSASRAFSVEWRFINT